jgi:hypothetical protein
MADEKRDESRDVWIFRTRVGRGLLDSDAAPGLKKSSVHYVPASELEAAQRRIAELETAARLVVDNIPGCLCQTVEFDMYAHALESLLTEEPDIA